MIRIEVIDVEFAYGTEPILKGTSFHVGSGEFVGLIGPNGCGKSTLLRCMTGALKARQGVVLVDGRDVASYRRDVLARLVAVVSQESPLQFDFTVEELVSMGRMPHTSRFGHESRRDGEAIERALRDTGLTSLSHRPATDLSGGERQRVALARALAQEPSILLLDEPTAHLDVHYQMFILDLIWRRNRAEGLTVFAVLHDLNLAAQYCDRLILLHEGRIYRAGKPVEVLVAETLREVFRIQAVVMPHPLAEAPYMLLLSEAKFGSHRTTTDEDTT